MAKQKSLDERVLEWVENHRILIGGGLVAAVLAGAIALSILSRQPQVVEKSIVDPAIEEQLVELRQQNDLLRKQIEEINAAKVAGASAKLENKKTVAKQNISAPGAAQSDQININTADQKALESLPKIGPAIAQRIIDYRVANDGFKTIENIKNVKGIGDKIFEQIKNQIRVE